MTFVQPIWNGPICPGCGRGYIQPTLNDTFTTLLPYKPRHRKPGPAQ